MAWFTERTPRRARRTWHGDRFLPIAWQFGTRFHAGPAGADVSTGSGLHQEAMPCGVIRSDRARGDVALASPKEPGLVRSDEERLRMKAVILRNGQTPTPGRAIALS